MKAARPVRAGGPRKPTGSNADRASRADPTEKPDPADAGTGNIRNGTRSKTVLTEAFGQVEIEVPRDWAGTFEPQIVKTQQRRLNGVDEVVLSAYAKGLTTGEISAHFAEIYGASVSKETIWRITDEVLEEMNDWQVRPSAVGCAGLASSSAQVNAGSMTSPTSCTHRTPPAGRGRCLALPLLVLSRRPVLCRQLPRRFSVTSEPGLVRVGNYSAWW